MCISLLSTAHPDYPFILLNNRDEFLNRATASARWWENPDEHVLGGRDLQRQIRGTWLAITKQGRLANLTNFRDEGVEVSKDKSRGALVNAYVTAPADQDEDDDVFVERLVNDVGIHNVGGFTLLFGRLRAPKDGSLPGLALISNRTGSAKGIIRIASKIKETHGLSNSHYGDATWPKVVRGEEALTQAIEADGQNSDGPDAFIERLFNVLSVDTLPKRKADEEFQEYTRQMRNSILVPPVGGPGIETKPADQLASANGTHTPDHGEVKVGVGSYGTHKQTVILVSMKGHVKFVERTLYDAQGKAIPTSAGERRFEFDIEGW